MATGRVREDGALNELDLENYGVTCTGSLLIRITGEGCANCEKWGI